MSAEDFAESAVFKAAIEKATDGWIASATRLIAMKRPDVFVCLDARNRKGMCEAFGISPGRLTLPAYWDSIICRLQESAWWCSPKPKRGDERDVWESRAAFLDAIFYDGKDMPES